MKKNDQNVCFTKKELFKSKCYDCICFLWFSSLVMIDFQYGLNPSKRRNKTKQKTSETNNMISVVHILSYSMKQKQT